MAKTIYRVEGAIGEPPRASASPAGDPPGRPRPALREGPDLDAAKAKRRKLFWILLGVAILTAAMIAAIAALGASESPAVGTGLDPMTTWTQSYAPVTSPEPVGTSTTMGTLPADPSSTTSSSGSTSTTAFTHAITEPARVVIPALKVDAKMVAVGLLDDGAMEIPTVGIVGWYKLGPVPGAAGPAVIVSHVSWGGKKGAFYNLKNLKPGDEVRVYDGSGDCAVFQVDYSETILKTKLPRERIWNRSDQALIRLITCGGTYDSQTDHYLSNVIVYGHLIG